MMTQHTPFILQGVNPSDFESLKIHVQEEQTCYVVRALMPGVLPAGMY